MENKNYDNFKKKLKGQIREAEILAPYTSFKIGGPADLFYVTKDSQNLVEVIRLAHEYKIPTIILGNGSNILVSDSGFRGLVIKNECRNNKIEDNFIVAESGALLSQAILKAVNEGLGKNIWPLANIPGSIGGAIYGNAGSYNSDKPVFIGDFVVKVKIINLEGELKEVKNNYFEFGYRQTKLKQTGEIILEAILKDEKGDKEEILKLIHHDKTKRTESYPAFPFPGSFFKNPKHSYAGKLIENCGLKGYRVGEAKISEKHANFIINLGKAKARDVKKLAEIIKEKVSLKFGIKLEEEVQYIGDF